MEHGPQRQRDREREPTVPLASAVAQPVSSPGTTTDQLPSSLNATPTARAITPAGEWVLQPDAQPRSHRQREGHAARRAPLRSARVEIGDAWLATAQAGGPFMADLGAGLVVEGEFRVVKKGIAPGADLYAGTLANPPGTFHLEHHERGWAGWFRFDDADEVVSLMPDRFEPGITRLELWPGKEVVCAGADLDGDPNTAPEADPSLDQNNLQSRPGAENVLYLDFNGETVTDSVWNTWENSFQDIVAAPSGMSRDAIIAAWARAAEDWITFNVNVTTNRTIYNNTAWHSRAMIICTPTKQWYTEGEPGIGGVANIDGFNNAILSSVGWCFNVNNYLTCAETISHEAGHLMGNTHSSWESPSGNEEVKYYEGHDTHSGIRWAPIMGWSPAAGVDGLTQFTNGFFSGSTNDEDQLDEIAYELDAIGDENSLLIPELLTLSGNSKKVKGLINSGGDVDSYVIDLPSGPWDILVEPNSSGPNVDIKATMRLFPADTVVDRDDNDSGAKYSLSANLRLPADHTGGLHRINIASDSNTGYTTYGGVGSYRLSIKRPEDYESNAPVLESVYLTGFKQGSKVAEADVIFKDASHIIDFFGGAATAGVSLERVSGGVSVSGVKVGAAQALTGDTGATTVHRKRQKFRFAAPGGWWDAAEVGSYRLRVGQNAAIDDWGNVSAVTLRDVSALAPDTTAPVITAAISPANVAEGSSESVRIDITITDDSPIIVRDEGQLAFEAISSAGAATLHPAQSFQSTENGGRKRTLRYFAKQTGGWTQEHTGAWNVQVRSGRVRDSAGNITAPAVLGTFTVARSLYFQDFDLGAGAHGFTLDTGWEHGIPFGNGHAYQDPASAYSPGRVLGYALLENGGQYTNNLPERRATTPLVSTAGYENIRLRYRRFLTVRAGDEARIEVNDETADDAWTVVWRASATSGHNERGWKLHEIDLPSFVANKSVQVRWVMGSTNKAGTAGGWTLDDVEILASGTYRPGALVTATPTYFILAEGGAAGSYTLRLNQKPTWPVAVALTAPDDVILSTPAVNFTTANWSVPRTVTVTAKDDAHPEETELLKIRHTTTSLDLTFAGVTKDVPLAVVDNDDSMIQTQPADRAGLEGSQATFSVSIKRDVSGETLQWYEGEKHLRPRAIPGATGATHNVTIGTGPKHYFVRVTTRGAVEDSRQATVNPLTGEEEFEAQLLGMGYTQPQLDAPGFDDQDPDKNGLTHFMEYALGLLPGMPPEWLHSLEAVPAASGIPGETDLLITLRPLQPGVRYTLQSSPDGQTWTDVIDITAQDTIESLPVIRVPGAGQPGLLVRLKLQPL